MHVPRRRNFRHTNYEPEAGVRIGAVKNVPTPTKPCLNVSRTPPSPSPLPRPAPHSSSTRSALSGRLKTLQMHKLSSRKLKNNCFIFIYFCCIQAQCEWHTRLLDSKTSRCALYQTWGCFNSHNRPLRHTPCWKTCCITIDFISQRR